MARAIKTRTTGHSSPKRKAARTRTAHANGAEWNIRRSRGLQIVESRALGKLSWLAHGFSTRPGGASTLNGKPALNLGFTGWDEHERVAANRVKFVATVGARGMELVALRQFHSDVVYVAGSSPQENAPASKLRKSDSAKADAPNTDAPKADALITNTPGLLLGVQTADCVPILLADARRRVVAAVHAGWRGTLARIVQKTLGRMRMEFGTRTRDVVAAIGPAIGGGCYEVGAEVAQAFATQFPPASEWFDGPFEQLAHGEEPLWLPWLTMMPPGHVPPPPRVQLDLRAANRWQLLDAGVPEKQIDVNDLCTACRGDLLFSYRREGAKTGRLMAVIGIRKK